MDDGSEEAALLRMFERQGKAADDALLQLEKAIFSGTMKDPVTAKITIEKILVKNGLDLKLLTAESG